MLRGGATALRIGRNVREMERLVAASFGKRRGIMCNSGSSALYLAIELLGLEEGDEILTSPLTFSTDIAPMLRSRLVPVFVDVTPDTYQIDVERIEPNLGPRTKAILAPNLTGNCPDWDAIREIASRRGLRVVEDSCDCLGTTLRGTPTGTRSDLSVTSFALSHIITAAGTGGMLLCDDEALADRCLLLRRWGGDDGLRRLFDALAGGAGFDAAVRTTYYLTEADFEERWQQDVASRYGWLAGATAAAFAWALLGLVVAALALLRRRRDAERRARLDAVPWGGPPDEPNA